MLKASRSNNNNSYIQIYHLFHQKKYKEAEKIVVGLLEIFVSKKYSNQTQKEKDLIFLETICNDFNDHYLQWLKASGKQDEALSINPDSCDDDYNHFLVNTTNPDKMSAILWELGTHLVNGQKDPTRQKILTFLREYKKLLK